MTVSFEKPGEPKKERSGLMRIFGAAPGLFATTKEADAFICTERDA